jgi:hypothetical protein
MRYLQLRNSCNAVIAVSLDSGATDTYFLEQGDDVSIDLWSNGTYLASGVQVQAKAPFGLPTTGTFRVNGAY